jgi:hypothetical protein
MKGRTGAGEGTVWRALEEAARRARAGAIVAVLAAAASVVPVLLLVAWLVGDSWGLRGLGPLVLVVVGVVAGGSAALILGRRWVRPVTADSVAAAAERRRRLPDGTVRGVLELGRGLAAGTSEALFRRSEREVAARLEGMSRDELSGDVGQRVRTRRLGAASGLGLLGLLTVAAGFGMPDRARAGWAPLLHPVAHLRGPVLPALGVRPGDAEVPRGGWVDVDVAAPLRSEVTVWSRSPGQVPREERVAVADGRAAARVGPVEAPLEYRIRAPDGATTRVFTLRPVDPLLLSGLSLELVFPAHVGREAERLEGEIPPLRVPEGTVLRLAGQATRPLDSATLRHQEGESRPADVRGPGFVVDWPASSGAAGRWVMHLTDAAGEEATPLTLDLAVVRDEAPTVRILQPGADTLMPASLRQPVLADASDDHGLAAAELVFQRVDPRGGRGPVTRIPLPLERGSDRAIVRALLDASDHPLLPGDVVEYHVVVRDNSPAGQTGRSATHLLRLASRGQLRDAARSESDRLLESARRLAEQGRELERATRELSRRSAGQGRWGQSGSDARSSPDGQRLDFQRAREAQALAERHEDALREIEALREGIDRLQRALEEAALRDPEIARKLEQLRDLYAQVGSDEARDRTEALRQAAEELDPAAVAEALERLAEQQEEIRSRLEESLDLLRRSALEQEMGSLAREAEEIAAEQEALAAAMRDLGAESDPSGPGGEAETGQEAGQASEEQGGTEGQEAGQGQESGESEGGEAEAGQDTGSETGSGPQDEAEARAQQQDKLRERAEQLSQSLDALQRQLFQMGDSEGASQAGEAQEQGQSAGQAMQEAAEQARQQQGEGAARAGERAAGSMSAAAQSLDQARDRMGEAGREQAQQAVQQATQEALRLAEREEALRQQMDQARQGGGPGGAELRQMQSEQAAVQEGLRQLGQNLSEAGQGTTPPSREVTQALARATLQMEQTLQSLQEGRMPVEQAERTVEALNRLAMALLENDMTLQQARAGNQEQALRRLTELAREQGALNAQTSAFMPQDLPDAARQGPLQQLAEQQSGIARRVGEISDLAGGREDVLGRLNLLAAEAESIARDLAGGRLEPELRARQDRLFHRLLDAGRTLEREEYTDERVGEAPTSAAVLRPDELDPRLEDTRLRYPGPTAEQLRSLPPAYRRLIVEYFQRLNREAAVGGAESR